MPGSALQALDDVGMVSWGCGLLMRRSYPPREDICKL
jgi:hypothetical protein